MIPQITVGKEKEEKSRLNAVIYARYSCDNQREESIEGQIRECNEFAEKNGITVLRCYIDRAFSAKTDNRPQFLEMIKDADKRLFDTIIVWKLDRFARNRYDSAKYKYQLKKNGVKVISATQIISEGSEGILLESILEGYAEYYSAELSEKVIRGMTENILKGKFNGGSIPIGFNLVDHHLEIDPLTAPFIIDAFKLYDSGKTMREIRDYLNEKGVKSSKGKPVTYNTVQVILHNRRYIGENHFRDIVMPDSIPAIVPRDLFDRVQADLEKNRKSRSRKKSDEEYLLTTKLYCGHCGALMIGESGKGRGGGIYRYYKCAVIKNNLGVCDKKPIKKDFIEDFIIRKTLEMLSEEKTVDAIVNMVMDLQKRENTSLPLLEKQLSETDTAINNLLLAIQQGILTKATKSRLDELEAMKDELEVKILNEKITKPAVDETFVRKYLKRFVGADYTNIEQRKALIDTFINAIYLFNDKIVIAYNYREEQETVLLSDVTCSSKDWPGAPKQYYSNLFG